MQSVTDRPRELVIPIDIRTKHIESAGRCDGLRCRDLAENADRLFNAFFTTKSSGMGMGYRSARSGSHGGRMSAQQCGQGARISVHIAIASEETL